MAPGVLHWPSPGLCTTVSHPSGPSHAGSSQSPSLFAHLLHSLSADSMKSVTEAEATSAAPPQLHHQCLILLGCQAGEASFPLLPWRRVWNSSCPEPGLCLGCWLPEEGDSSQSLPRAALASYVNSSWWLQALPSLLDWYELLRGGMGWYKVVMPLCLPWDGSVQCSSQ